MTKHMFAKSKLFECIGVKIGIYSPHSSYKKDIMTSKNTAGSHLDGSIERAWSKLASSTSFSKHVSTWDIMILSTHTNKELESEIAKAISSEYFGFGNTGLFTSLFTDAIKQATKELRSISHLSDWS